MMSWSDFLWGFLAGWGGLTAIESIIIYVKKRKGPRYESPGNRPSPTPCPRRPVKVIHINIDKTTPSLKEAINETLRPDSD